MPESNPVQQQQSDYKYTPSSAKSTRQILDSFQISASDPAPSSKAEDAFRPQVFRRRTSNYETAAAAAAVTAAMEETAAEDKERSEASWKPQQLGRKQSWNPQDMKHQLQMSTVGTPGPGFSEAGRENAERA